MSAARRHLLLVLGVTAAGAALRFRGLDWGLPWALHIDERLFVVAKAIRLERVLEGGGAPDPGISSYGILPLWLLVAARKLFLGAAAASGPPAYGDDFAGTVLLARWISALWGTATIVLVAMWARRWGAGTAALSAALVAGFPALVQASHFGTVEAPLVALLAAGMLAAERLAERPGPGRAAAAGAVLGLAASVKAPGAVLALPMLHAAWAAAEPAGGDVARAGSASGRIRRVVLLTAAAAVVAVALNPGLLTGPAPAGGPDQGEHTTLAGNLRRAYSSDFHDWTLPYAHDVPGWTELTRLLPHAMGVLPELLAVAGLILLLRRRDARDVRLLLLLAPVLLLVLPANVKTVRFVLPALPALAVCAAVAVAAVTARRPRAYAAAAGSVGALALLHGAAFSAIYAETDARVAAARWLDGNVTGREIVAVEDPPGYGPPLGSPSRELTRPDLRYELLWRDFYTGHERATEDERRAHLEAVLRRSTWLALSEGHRAGFTAAPELRPVESGFYRALDAGELPFRKATEFKAYPRLGPLVLRDDGAEVLMRVFDHPRVEIWKRVEP